jgi:type II secretory pathway pseudopilin PulG
MVEVLVVVSIVVLMMAVAIPSINQLFTSGADAQAYNVIAAQLAAARALAIQKQTYAGVHVQRAAPTLTKLSRACFSAVVWDNPAPATPPDPNFTLAPGFFPKRLPGGMVMGQISNTYYDTTNNTYLPTVSSEDFCNFTIVFTPTGQLAKNYNVTFDSFDSNDPIFDPNSGKEYLWYPPPSSPSINGMVLFDGDKFFPLPAASKQQYLAMNGQVIGVNWYTGAVLGR